MGPDAKEMLKTCFDHYKTNLILLKTLFQNFNERRCILCNKTRKYGKLISAYNLHTSSSENEQFKWKFDVGLISPENYMQKHKF